MSSVAVIGGGPAGIMAAAMAAQNGHGVTLYEKNEKLGKKLYITGKGRCNITNDCDIEDFFANIPRNPKFLYSALYGFTNSDIISVINSMGVPTKVERGKRVFPASDKSSDVIKALSAYLNKSGARLCLNSAVESIAKTGAGFEVKANGQVQLFDRVILCTGGASYPSTGSNGAGYAFAKSMGHTVTDIRPSLIPLATVEQWPTELSGLSLKNVTLRAYNKKGRQVYEELGEMLFTHFGVSGPMVLSASSRIADDPGGAVLTIDMKPGLTREELDRRLLRDFEKNIRKQLVNSLSDLLPSRMIPIVIMLCGVPGETQVSSVTREMREALLSTLKCIRLTVDHALPVEEAIITRGGINVKEINASTMESKLVPGLYFAGEVIDVDGYTGGFNLQIAYSTGALAGRSV
ncbi:MAG: NAD(P)/FAD-dependent oxidoreductase [Clostridia bacterium]|nr:NAD(P)/FAD-dependent oxidoreductase [Clostridia bacterium]